MAREGGKYNDSEGKVCGWQGMLLMAIPSQLVTKEGEVWNVCHHQAKA